MLQNEPQISEFKSKSGLARIMAASGYSIQGLKLAWKTEHAFRQEIMVSIPALAVAALLPVSVLEKLALICVLAFVLIVELLNSAVEAVVDRVSLERHPLSKNAKDLGSAAVFLSVIVAAFTWVVILVPVFLA
jgi:diacylglycerol kinase (ATP)